jgi:hypothetical protein
MVSGYESPSDREKRLAREAAARRATREDAEATRAEEVRALLPEALERFRKRPSDCMIEVLGHRFLSGIVTAHSTSVKKRLPGWYLGRVSGVSTESHDWGAGKVDYAALGSDGMIYLRRGSHPGVGPRCEFSIELGSPGYYAFVDTTRRLLDQAWAEPLVEGVDPECVKKRL